MPQDTTSITIRQESQQALNNSRFKKMFVSGPAFVLCILSFLPFFFQAIEQRHGIVLNDPLLRWIPAHNVSVPLFIVIWALTLFSVFRSAQHPRMFINYLWAFIVLSLLRITTITLVPLDPPAGLIGLMDPLSNAFYGAHFITKDLFFSGHTSAVFLLCLCLPGRTDKKLGLLATLCVAFLLLVQHVHYTLDVVCGFFFAWIPWWVSTSVVLRGM